MGKKRRRAARQRHNKRRKSIEEFSLKLEANTPKSEIWFRELYKPYKHFQDEYNQVFGGYLPDVINKFYKYIIEVDGSIHDRADIQRHDRKKDSRYKSTGYRIIRIKAYNMDSFNNGMKRICKIRGPHYKPAKIYSKEEIAQLTSSSKTTDSDRK